MPVSLASSCRVPAHGYARLMAAGAERSRAAQVPLPFLGLDVATAVGAFPGLQIWLQVQTQPGLLEQEGFSRSKFGEISGYGAVSKYIRQNLAFCRAQHVLQQPLPERRHLCGGTRPAPLPLPTAVERGRLPAPHADRWVTQGARVGCVLCPGLTLPRCPAEPPAWSATADPAFSRKPRCAQVEHAQQCRCEPGFHMSGTAAASLCRGKGLRGCRVRSKGAVDVQLCLFPCRCGRV